MLGSTRDTSKDAEDWPAKWMIGFCPVLMRLSALNEPLHERQAVKVL